MEQCIGKAIKNKEKGKARSDVVQENGYVSCNATDQN